MAKRLFLIAVGALALTACTSEDVLDDVATTSNAIQFENSVNKLSRAEDLTYGNLKQFYVFGFYTPLNNAMHAHKVFHNTPVKKDDQYDSWSYSADSTRYWVPGAKYYFYAYSCGNVSNLNPDYGSFTVDMDDNDPESAGMSADKRELVINNYRCDSKHQHDLLFAYYETTGKDGTNSNVAFEFSHILSKLQAQFSTSFNSEYHVVIKDVQFRNIYNQADFKNSVGWSDYTRVEDDGTPVVYLQDTNGNGYPKDENGQSKKDSEIIVAMDSKEYPQQALSNYAYVIPNKYQQSNVVLSFLIDLKYGDDFVIQNKKLTATLMPEWKQGYYYLYKIDINALDLQMNKIDFQVSTVKGWSSDDTFNGDIKPTPTPDAN